MRSKYITIYITFSLCVYMSCAGSQIAKDSGYDRFLCGNSYSKVKSTYKKINVGFMTEDFIIEERPKDNPKDIAFAIPYKANVKAYIVQKGRIIKPINSLSNFSGYASIDSNEKAVEFVRFLTNFNTNFLFSPDIFIELFQSEDSLSCQGSISKEIFNKYSLENMKIKRINNHFEIDRYLLHCSWGPVKREKSPTIFHFKEKVDKNGRYTVEKKMVNKQVEDYDIICPFPPM